MIVPQKGKAKFDIGHLSPRALTYSDVSKSAQRKARPLMSCDAVCDVMIGSSDWLKVYGLAANKISLEHILPASGFKHSNDYDDVIKKNVSSKYGEGYFDRYLQKDGKVYNLTGDKQKVQQYIQQVNAAISVYKERLEWLTNGSRRFFGVTQEKTVTIIIDVHTPDDQRYFLFISALKELMHEQVSKLERFNLIRTGQDVRCFSDGFVPVNNSSINAAIEWIDDMNRYTLQTTTCVAEAVSKAFSFAIPSSKYGVYLFTENGATDGARELLKSKVTEFGYPLHTVSYNSTDEHTIKFLRGLSQCCRGGRFHAFSVTETDVDPLTGEVSYYGGTPSGSGTPEEIMLIWNELETAKDILYQLETINKETGPQKPHKRPADNPFTSQKDKENIPAIDKEDKDNEVGSFFPVLRHSDMQYMDSKTWLLQNGIKTRGLDFYAFLGGVAFRHCDGVVKQSHRVEKNSVSQTNVNDWPEEPKPEFEMKKTLINAKYCEKFVHVLWKDGRVRHVQVTGKMFREYENKMNTLLKALNTRINWLCQGSRELFGTICEEKVYILIDTSASMESRLKMVKDKLYQLMQEQLRHKVMFNIVAFDSHVKPWRDALVNVTETHLRQAWDWVKDVETGGSTNTLGALKMALGDHNTQAVYLLSDGRPDQLPKSIYAQACLHPRVPVHTISFNCHDKDANIFLKELAEISRGRFHIYHDSRAHSDLPKGFQSEDLSLLKKEADEAKQSLRLVAKLRAECAAHEWSLDSKSSNAKLSRSLSGSATARPYSASPRKGPTSDSSSSGGFRKGPARKYRLIDPQKEMQEMSETDSPRLQLMRKTIETMTQYNMENQEASGASTDRTATSDAEIPGTARETWLLEETQRLFQNQRQRRNEALKSASELLNQIETSRNQDSRRSFRKTSDGMSLRQWIKANGLVTKRLTIIDALSKTLITQRPMFVPSIDKVVLSRVFDDILPISYATTRQKNEIHLVNPAAVDLKAYESQLTETIQSYYEKLDRCIWDSFPSSEREGYNNIAPNWETDRLAILESLQRCNWPISREDIRLVDDEIELGKKFLQQSIDLRLCGQSSMNQPDTSRNSSPRKSACSTPRRTNRSSEKPSPRVGKQVPRAKSSNAQRSKQPVMQEVTAKVELSQDEINLVHFYRQKMRQNSLNVKSVPGFRPNSSVKKERKEQMERKVEKRDEADRKSDRSMSKKSQTNSNTTVSQLDKKTSRSSRSSMSTRKSLSEDQGLETPKNSPSTGIEGAAETTTDQQGNGEYSYEDTFEKYETSKTEASKSNTGRWNQSSVDRSGEVDREVIGSYKIANDDALLHNILKQDEKSSSRSPVNSPPIEQKNTPSKSLESSSAIAQGTGYLDEDDFFED